MERFAKRIGGTLWLSLYNDEDHAETKHLNIQYHWIQECVQSDKVILGHCTIADVIVNIMTKGLGRERQWKPCSGGYGNGILWLIIVKWEGSEWSRIFGKDDANDQILHSIEFSLSMNNFHSFLSNSSSGTRNRSASLERIFRHHTLIKWFC
jgi:hypothetical protein